MAISGSYCLGGDFSGLNDDLLVVFGVSVSNRDMLVLGLDVGDLRIAFTNVILFWLLGCFYICLMSFEAVVDVKQSEKLDGFKLGGDLLKLQVAFFLVKLLNLSFDFLFHNIIQTSF